MKRRDFLRSAALVPLLPALSLIESTAPTRIAVGEDPWEMWTLEYRAAFNEAAKRRGLDFAYAQSVERHPDRRGLVVTYLHRYNDRFHLQGTCDLPGYRAKEVCIYTEFIPDLDIAQFLA